MPRTFPLPDSSIRSKVVPLSKTKRTKRIEFFRKIYLYYTTSIGVFIYYISFGLIRRKIDVSIEDDSKS
jgi:hypothetical protein